MRTTLTLDDDVAARLKALIRSRRRPLKVVVNEILRAGLSVVEKGTLAAASHRTTGFDLGPSLVGSLDNIEDVLSCVDARAVDDSRGRH